MTASNPRDVLLDVKGLSKRFGGVVALNAFDLTQHRGETLGMIGPNGSSRMPRRMDCRRPTRWSESRASFPSSWR